MGREGDKSQAAVCTVSGIPEKPDNDLPSGSIPALMARLPEDAYLIEFVIEVHDDGATDEEIVTDEFDMGADM